MLFLSVVAAGPRDANVAPAHAANRPCGRAGARIVGGCVTVPGRGRRHRRQIPTETDCAPSSRVCGAALVDYPERGPGDLYCRVPQDSPFNVRGARNIPCETRPGKRAATVKLCESDEPYVPLNDGYNWKVDPNATVTGQGVPHMPPGAPPPPPLSAPSPPAVAGVLYDPETGAYIAPDGSRYTRSDLAADAPADKTWQSMLVPPG